MTDAPNNFRLRLVLGKFKVTQVNAGQTGTYATIQLPGAVTMRIDIPLRADVRVGDLLTIYTEVLCDANPIKAPIQ